MGKVKCSRERLNLRGLGFCCQGLKNEGRFALSFASSSRLRCACFIFIYSSRDFFSDFCITNETIQSTTTTPRAIKIYITTLPPVFHIIIARCSALSITRNDSAKHSLRGKQLPCRIIIQCAVLFIRSGHTRFHSSHLTIREFANLYETQSAGEFSKYSQGPNALVKNQIVSH